MIKVRVVETVVVLILLLGICIFAYFTGIFAYKLGDTTQVSNVPSWGDDFIVMKVYPTSHTVIVRQYNPNGIAEATLVAITKENIDLIDGLQVGDRIRGDGDGYGKWYKR